MVESGRVKNTGNFQLKTALHRVVQKFNLPMRLTPNQNIILYDIEPNDQEAIATIFQEYGVELNLTKIDPLVRYAMACPALPLCGLAVTESERVISEILNRIRALLTKLDLNEQNLVIRMTGCPNGCARPYMAELGFVGSAPDTYQVWLGGTPDQTQLARPYTQKLHIDNLEEFLTPLFVYFKYNRKFEESFGAFCNRIGFEELQRFSEQIDLNS